MTELNQPENDFSTIEELTAYLDGELDQESIQRVEQRLGDDPAYLAEMQSLQRTWDLLDAIPTTEPGTSFTKTTMELVVGEAVRSAQTKRNRSWVWPIRIAIMLAIPALLFGIAFSVMRNLQTRSDRVLMENLSEIENYPRYDAITFDMEFLTKLTERSLFTDSKMMVDEQGNLTGIENPDIVPNAIPPSEEVRLAFVQSLDMRQIVDLKRKLEDFQKLSPEEVRQLTEFDADLQSRANKNQLLLTLNAYYDWLREVDPGEKSRLRDKSADARIEMIVAIKNQQALEEFGKDMLAKLPSADDAEPILGWCESVFRLKEEQIRDRFADVVVQYVTRNGGGRSSIEIVRQRAKQGNLHMLVDFLVRTDREFIGNLILENREMSMLYDMLSPIAQRQLDDRSEVERRELILTWVESANQAKREIPVEVLKQFEQRLPPKDRGRLAKMSTEDYVVSLKHMFMERRKSSQSRSRYWNDLEEMDFESFMESN